MNKDRRHRLYGITNVLYIMRYDVKVLQAEEQVCYKNMPSRWQCSPRGGKMQEAIVALDFALSHLEKAIKELEIAAK